MFSQRLFKEGSPSTLQLIERAKQVLEKGGWQQYALGSRYHDDTHHCALGALYVAARLTMEKNSDAPVSKASRVLREVLNHRCSHDDETSNIARLSLWNDMPDRTEGEVIDLFTEAEQMLRGAV